MSFLSTDFRRESSASLRLALPLMAAQIAGVGMGTVDTILAGRLGPAALAAPPRLIREVPGRPVDDARVADTAGRIATARASDEGREGVASFLEKRRPGWVLPG